MGQDLTGQDLTFAYFPDLNETAKGWKSRTKPSWLRSRPEPLVNVETLLAKYETERGVYVIWVRTNKEDLLKGAYPDTAAKFKERTETLATTFKDLHNAVKALDSKIRIRDRNILESELGGASKQIAAICQNVDPWIEAREKKSQEKAGAILEKDREWRENHPLGHDPNPALRKGYLEAQKREAAKKAARQAAWKEGVLLQKESIERTREEQRERAQNVSPGEDRGRPRQGALSSPVADSGLAR